MRGDNYVIKDVNNLSGLDKLRIRAAGHERRGEMDAANALYDIADQIERERACDADTIENIRLIVGGVVDEMERHVSGVEGMEDSPVARWARELREALGVTVPRHESDGVADSPYDAILPEDREAIAWVREHGGLERVKAQRRESMPRAAYERKKAGFLDHIAECETALGRRREIISELNHRASDLTRKNAQMRPRLMPEGYEWPRFESGEQVMLGDSVVKYVGGGEFEVRSIEFRDGVAYLREGFRTEGIVIVRPGERVKRPAPKVLDADGVEIRRGDTLWHVETGEQCKVVGVDSRSVSVDFRVDGDGTKHTGSVLPSNLTHRAPVLAADGRPLREGETVFNERGDKFTVSKVDHERGVFSAIAAFDGREGIGLSPIYFSHEHTEHKRRPEIDSWERLEEDAKLPPLTYCIKRGIADMDATDADNARVMATDLVRRAKALSERGA